MSIVAPERGECPACGERVGTNVYGQIHPHKGRNGCTYSGNGHVINPDWDPSDYYPQEDR